MVYNIHMVDKKNTDKKRSKASKAASAMGRLGGRALVKKRGKSHMSEIGKMGAKARWSEHGN